MKNFWEKARGCISDYGRRPVKRRKRRRLIVETLEDRSLLSVVAAGDVPSAKSAADVAATVGKLNPNGDLVVSAADALYDINCLNRMSDGGGEASSPKVVSAPAPVQPMDALNIIVFVNAHGAQTVAAAELIVASPAFTSSVATGSLHLGGEYEYIADWSVTSTEPINITGATIDLNYGPGIRAMSPSTGFELIMLPLKLPAPSSFYSSQLKVIPGTHYTVPLKQQIDVDGKITSIGPFADYDNRDGVQFVLSGIAFAPTGAGDIWMQATLHLPDGRTFPGPLLKA